MIGAASRAYFGHPVSISEVYSQAWRFIRPFFAANLLQGLAYAPVGLVLFLVLMSTRGNQTVGIIILALLGGPIIIALATRWGVVLPAIMFESLSASDGLRRSWFLTKNEFWHTCIPIFSSSLLSYLIVALPALLIDYLFQWLSVPEVVLVGTMSSLVLTQLGQIIALPLTLSIQVILYYDLRVRHEGYDLELALQTTTVKDSQEKETLA
jgi:membrane-anchored glycerophosphoryl diester phosphodiesterase (GDPDase)